MFKADLQLDDDLATVKFIGNAAELKPGIIPEVRKALDNNIRTILLDMSGVQFIDAEGIKTIADTVHYAHRREGKIFLTDIQPATQRLIVLNHPGWLVPMFETKRDALREIGFQRLNEYIPPKMNILVMQNLTPVFKELSRLFKQKRLWYTYKMKTVEPGPEAKEMVRDFRPAVVLIDSTMQLEDSTRFVEWLKSDFLYWHIPVLIVATEGMARKALHLVQNGADDIIYFPFRADELNARLQFAIQMYNIVRRERERQADAENSGRM